MSDSSYQLTAAAGTYSYSGLGRRCRCPGTWQMSPQPPLDLLFSFDLMFTSDILLYIVLGALEPLGQGSFTLLGLLMDVILSPCYATNLPHCTPTVCLYVASLLCRQPASMPLACHMCYHHRHCLCIIFVTIITFVTVVFYLLFLRSSIFISLFN
jgi:hypothetical protein